jgi:signal recognition particle subunit SRP54
MIQKMGSLGGILKMNPGLGSAMGQLGDVSAEDKKFKHLEAMILSMTPLERRKPDIINSGRKKRIANGSGRSVQEVNRLLEQLGQMNKMMKKMNKIAEQGKDPMAALKGIFR